MKQITGVLLLVGLLIVMVGCMSEKETTMVGDLLREAKQKFAPDKRKAVFTVQGELKGKTLTLKGDVQNAELKQQLLTFLKERKGYEIVDSLQTLPASTLGDRTFALVSLSVANIRTKPDHAAEMGTQAILGTPLNVLKKERDGWYLVQTPDEYLGWTDDIIQLMNREEYQRWSRMPKVIVTAVFAFTHQSKESASPVVSDVVAGGLLGLKSDVGSHYEVAYPDGRTAYLAKQDAEPFQAWLEQAKDTPENIIATARRFFGIPYLWGGTSAKGMDCSGFTKTVYFLNGVLLPRDASQQILVGDPVETDMGFENVHAGDLLFFGRRGTAERPEHAIHVAISLGGKRFIHSSGDVRVNSLDPADPDYSSQREKSFLRVKRIIGAGEQSGVRRLGHVSYYWGE